MISGDVEIHSYLLLKDLNMSPIKSLALLGTVHSFFLYAPTLSAQTTPSPDDEIIITGSPLTRSLDDAITGLSVLTGDELQDRIAATIGETLKTEPEL